MQTVLPEVFRRKVLPVVREKIGQYIRKRQKRDPEGEELRKRMSRHASLEASFKGDQGSTSSCRAEEELRYILFWSNIPKIFLRCEPRISMPYTNIKIPVFSCEF